MERKISSLHRSVTRERFALDVRRIFALAANFLFSFYPLCGWRLTFVIKALSRETSKYGRRCRKKTRCSKLCLHAVRYPVIYYTETLILLLLLISLFPRCYFLIKEPNNQFTYYMSLESFKLLFKISNATFSWVFNPLHPKIIMHILHTVLYTFPEEKRRRLCLLIKSFISWWSFSSFSWP